MRSKRKIVSFTSHFFFLNFSHCLWYIQSNQSKSFKSSDGELEKQKEGKFI